MVQLLLSPKDETDAARSINARLLSAGVARYQPPRRKVCQLSVAFTDLHKPQTDMGSRRDAQSARHDEANAD